VTWWARSLKAQLATLPGSELRTLLKTVGSVGGRAHARTVVVRARCSNWCYAAVVSTQPEITQRDLRMRSKEIMDAVERGQAFTVTRDGHRIGELVPLRQRRRFVSRAEFAAMSRTAPAIDADAFRADRDAVADQAGSAYDR
jgi:prevent-host-death family protein